jgi:hypothetical protein
MDNLESLFSKPEKGEPISKPVILKPPRALKKAP